MAQDPGSPIPASSQVSDQKPGSVLFYNFYTSSASNPNAENTDISITNTASSSSASVHLFFVNGATGKAGDLFITLAPKQTMSFLASDIDPGTTGYIVAVAVDGSGCPVSYNFLVGGAYIKLASGHTASLNAEAFAALYPGTLPGCDPNSGATTLNFDGVSYNRAPRVLAVDTLLSPADGNSTILVVNRFGGSFLPGESAAVLGPVSGLLFDDVENSYSFTFSARAQFRSMLSDGFPLTSPRFSTVIPSKRSGWMKLFRVSDGAILGAMINFNPNTATDSLAFDGGHNLHKLTLTTAALTIPIFPPSATTDLAITKTHSNDFGIGSTEAYTITVSNVGSKPAAGTITVNDQLPGNLTLASFSGTDWSCFGIGTPSVSCVNNTVLAPGASLPPLTIRVKIGAGTPVGTNSITNVATVSTVGDTNPSNSIARDPTTINTKIGTTTIVTSSMNPSTFGQPVTFTATVSSVAGVPTGTVEFFDSGVSLGRRTLSGGKASITPSTLAVGTHEITAVYGGDANFNGSTSPVLAQTVNPVIKISTTTTLTSSVNPSTFGQSVTFTATVSPATATTNRPTGTVQFFDGGTLLATVPLVNGAATLTINTLTIGTHSITAVYSGDANFHGSTSPALSQSVVQMDPGLPIPASSAVSDQKAGSVLFYNFYTSNSARPHAENTEITITNTNPNPNTATTPAAVVHLFFVNAATGKAADTFIRLLPNQTMSLLASEVYPDTTGYVVAVAVDEAMGCPKSFNFLIGSAYIKLASGHTANLNAEAFAALYTPGTTLPGCMMGAPTTLNFDGASYNQAPRVLSIDNLPSPADGNSTLLILNCLAGDFTFGAMVPPLGPLTGVLYDDLERGFSFNASVDSVQFRDVLSNNFPRTTPRLSNIVTNGHSGWMKFWKDSDRGLLGAVINFNPNARTSFSAYNGGHELHKLTLAATSTITIPTAPLAADLSITKTHTGNFNLGSTGDYRITVSNAAGAKPATGTIVVTDQLPQNLTLVSFSGEGWNCSGVGGSNVVCTSSSGLGPGQSLPVLTLTVNVGPGTPAGGTVTNIATVALFPQFQETNLTNNQASDSTAINKANTATIVISSANPSVFGQPVTFTAVVSGIPSSAGTPTGTVQFKDNGAPLGSPVPLAGGSASITVMSLSVGTHTITAEYSGDASFNPSVGVLPGGQRVLQAEAIILLTTSVNPSIVGQTVIFKAMLGAVPPSEAVPTGTVQFFEGTTLLATVTLVDGVASFSTSALTAGIHMIRAVYQGDGGFGSVSSPPLTQVVNQLDIKATDPAPCTGSGNVISIEAKIANNATTTNLFSYVAQLPDQLTAVSGTCVAPGSSCKITGTQIQVTGAIGAGQVLTLSYKVQVKPGVTSGTRFCITSTLRFDVNNDGTFDSTSSVDTCFTANCPPAANPNARPPASSTDDQKTGSVLFFNLYSSNASNPNVENTRINLTNIDESRTAYVHLFLVDGNTCSVAGSYVCLTPAQTLSFLVSDIDPGVMGYVVAVVVDKNTGYPTNFNSLAGDEYVKLASGHAANLKAETFAAMAGLPTANNATAATLKFDGVSYEAAPRVLALDNIASSADSNTTLLVINPVDGDLVTGGSAINTGAMSGLLFDDQESGLSFTSTSSACQFKSTLSNGFPRTTPRFSAAIASGHSGWMKLWSAEDRGLLGAIINATPHAGRSPQAFNGGHNLHKLKLTPSSRLTIPVIAPNCL